MRYPPKILPLVEILGHEEIDYVCHGVKIVILAEPNKHDKAQLFRLRQHGSHRNNDNCPAVPDRSRRRHDDYERRRCGAVQKSDGVQAL